MKNINAMLIRLLHRKPLNPIKLWGLSLSLSGDAPYLYLQGETGLLRWQQDESRQHYFINVVQAMLKQYHTPEEVHRKAFFERDAAAPNAESE